MTIEEINNIAFQIISFAGDGKSCCLEAVYEAEQGNIEEADNLINQAEEAIREAHEVHTKLLQEEARLAYEENKSVTVNLMLCHASNHLTAAEVSYDFSKAIVNIYRKK